MTQPINIAYNAHAILYIAKTVIMHTNNKWTCASFQTSSYKMT